jgi:TP901 family phage tail tape measure protein
MAGRLEKLLMRVELIEKVTGPANRAASAVDKLIEKTQTGFVGVSTGVAGIWGVGLAFQSLTSDYREFHKEVAGVGTLGVANDVLEKLEKTALQFSIRFGESAAAFVNSSYEIQSAIAGLTGDELIAFTEAGNILAKGAKADAATITNYLGTMYGIFQNTADAMGRARWVEQLTGQTSMAVDIFKSDGMQMSAAFTSLGADAQAHGIAINEQMAVLGQLQATMSGSEAGTKYKAFLRGVGAAQKELGIQFTDSHGRMLPVSDILSKLQTKFGAIDTVAKSDLLKKAFGSDEAVATIKLLMNNAGGLADAINEIGKVNGMDQAIWKAEQLADPLARLGQVNTALKISFGALIEKALMPFYHSAIENLSVLNTWINKYPHLFGAIAKVMLVIFAITAAVAALAAIKGLGVIAVAGLTTAMALLRLIMVPFGPLLTALRFAWLIFNAQLVAGAGLIPALRAGLIALNTQLLINLRSLRLVRFATWLWTASLGLARAAVLATAIRFPALMNGLLVMRTGFMATATAARAFALALLANPITWIVLGVTALIAGLVLMVTHWDQVKLAAVAAIDWLLQKWTAFRAIIEDNPVLKFIFQPLLLAADVIGLVINNLDKIPQWFSAFKDWLADLNIFDVLLAPAKLALDALNLIPGVNLDASRLDIAKAPKTETAPVPEPFAPMVIPAQVQVKDPVQVPLVASLENPARIPPLIANADAQPDAVKSDREQLKPAPTAPVKNVPAGGLQQQFNSSSSSRTTHIGSLNVSTTQKVDGYSLHDQLLMAGG